MTYTVGYFTNLLINRKLILICDLDETLISTICLRSKHVQYNTDSYDFFQLPDGDRMDYYCMKKRPHLNSFLSRMNEMFELHLMSAGEGEYVRKCVDIIDPTHQFFGDRIVSRESIVDRSNKARTKLEMFPCSNMIISMDDRVDVWNHSPSVLQIKPFEYFKDINNRNKHKMMGDNNLKKLLKKRETYYEDDNFLSTLQTVFEDLHREFFDNLVRYNNIAMPDIIKIMDEKRNNGILKDREMSVLKTDLTTCKPEDKSDNKKLSTQLKNLKKKFKSISKKSKNLLSKG